MKIEWKQVLAAFFIGAMLAAAVTYRLAPHRHAHRGMTDRLTSELRLTEDQRQKVSAVLEDARRKMGALHDEMRPRYQEIKASSRAAIRGMLTPEQAARFDALVVEMDARSQARRERFAKS